MRRKVIAKRSQHEMIHKLPANPRLSTRSQDPTFTPSPSPPTSPPQTDPMARTKNPSRFPSSAKSTPNPQPPKEPSLKPGSSKPSSSKGKRSAATEPASEPTQPRTRSVPLRSQRDDDDEEFIPDESPPPSTEGTSISTGQKFALLNVVKDVVQKDRVAVFMKFIDNLTQDEDPATDVEEGTDSEGTGSDA
nr:extensin-like [Arachis hypogaea]